MRIVLHAERMGAVGPLPRPKEKKRTGQCEACLGRQLLGQASIRMALHLAHRCKSKNALRRRLQNQVFNDAHATSGPNARPSVCASACRKRKAVVGGGKPALTIDRNANLGNIWGNPLMTGRAAGAPAVPLRQKALMKTASGFGVRGEAVRCGAVIGAQGHGPQVLGLGGEGR